MNEKIRNIVMWKHSRETSVYVIFCLLIVAFIFLTPKGWFDKRERLATRTSRLIVQQSDFSPDRGVLDATVKELSGDPHAEIIDWHERRNARGETIYEIDIK